MLGFLKRGDMHRSNYPNKYVFCATALKKSLMTQLRKIKQEESLFYKDCTYLGHTVDLAGNKIPKVLVYFSFKRGL